MPDDAGHTGYLPCVFQLRQELRAERFAALRQLLWRQYAEIAPDDQLRIAVKTGAPVVPVAISGARGLFEAHGNRATPGSIHIRILPPIRTVGMSKAEQKQLPEAVRQTILAQL